jgi:hypothetical protein
MKLTIRKLVLTLLPFAVLAAMTGCQWVNVGGPW